MRGKARQVALHNEKVEKEEKVEKVKGSDPDGSETTILVRCATCRFRYNVRYRYSRETGIC